MKHGPNLKCLRAERIRRIGLISLISLIGLISPVCSAADIPALIEQLAAPKVRLRDEAQTALAELPESKAALEKAAISHPSAEARLRAKNLLQSWQRRLWEVTAEQPGQKLDPDSYIVPQPVRGAGDGRHFLGVSNYRVALWDAESLQQTKAFDDPGGAMSMSRRLLAASADGKRFARTGPMGEIIVTDSASHEVVATVPAASSQVTVQTVGTDGTRTPRTITRTMPPAHLQLMPDGSGLLTVTTATVSFRPLPSGEERSVPVSGLFPGGAVSVTPQALSISGDGKLALVACYFQGATDQMALLTLPALELKAAIPLPHVPMAAALNADGSEAIVALKEGGVIRLATQPNAPRQTLRFSGMASAVRWAADGKSAWIAGNKPDAPLAQVSPETGEAIWTAPPDSVGCYDVAVLSPDCVVTSWVDGALRVYRRRGAGAAPSSNAR